MSLETRGTADGAMFVCVEIGTMKMRAVVVGIWSNIALVKPKIKLYGILGKLFAVICGHFFPSKPSVAQGS